MKSLIKSTVLVSSLVALNLSYANTNLKVMNDLFYSQIKVPVSSVHHEQRNEDGSLVVGIQSYFNPNGYITKSIVNEQDGSVSEMTYQPYQENKREIIASTPYDKYSATKQWISPLLNTISSDTDDITANTEFDEQGNIIYQELFTDADSKPEKVTHFYYSEKGEGKPIIDVKNYGENENFSIFTILEKDKYGNWTKQKEEKSDGSIVIHTRTIKYAGYNRVVSMRKIL